MSSGNIELGDRKTNQENEPMVVTLRQCFTTIVDRKPLNVSMSSLRHILATDLNVNILSLQAGMDNVLAEALAYYMNLWPGWSRSSQYFTGQLQFKKWFEKFRQYLLYKINYVIMKSQSIGLNEKYAKIVHIKGNRPAHVEVQTDMIVQNTSQENKQDAPYKLSIAGPPHILNNLVFVKQGNDILIKQHLERPWTTLTAKQLVNWPHVSIEIKLPELLIYRKNILEYKRYVGLYADIKRTPPIDIETSVNELRNSCHSVYSKNYIQTYILKLLEIIKKCPQVNSDRVEIIDHMFSQFLEDIEEADVDKKTVCTYSSVNFHIGKSIYFRNKRIMSTLGNKNEVVNFYEFFAPKVEYGMLYFRATPDSATSTTSFKDLNKLENAISENDKKIEDLTFQLTNTAISFHCNMCNRNFTGPFAKESLLNHFKQVHKLEQPVLCFQCRRQHDVLLLSENRWKHPCIETNQSSPGS